MSVPLKVALFLFTHRHKPAQPSRLALPNKILLCASRRCWLAWARLVQPERVQLVELPVKHRVPVREGPQPLCRCRCPCPCLCPCRCHNQCQCRIHLRQWSWSRCPVAEPTHAKTRHQRARTRNIMTRRARSTTNNDMRAGLSACKKIWSTCLCNQRSWDFIISKITKASLLSHS